MSMDTKELKQLGRRAREQFLPSLLCYSRSGLIFSRLPDYQVAGAGTVRNRRAAAFRAARRCGVRC
jgi:hypothetical protein